MKVRFTHKEHGQGADYDTYKTLDEGGKREVTDRLLERQRYVRTAFLQLRRDVLEPFSTEDKALWQHVFSFGIEGNAHDVKGAMRVIVERFPLLTATVEGKRDAKKVQSPDAEAVQQL